VVIELCLGAYRIGVQVAAGTGLRESAGVGSAHVKPSVTRHPEQRKCVETS